MPLKKTRYQEYIPTSSFLQEYVSCYWTYSAPDMPEQKTAPNPIIPDGCVDIIFDLDVPSRSHCFVVGPMTKAIQNKKNNLFGIRLKPGKAFDFFQLPIQDMTDEIFSISKISTYRTDCVADQLANSNCIHQNIAFIETILETKLSKAPSLCKPIEYAISAIQTSYGMTNIQALTEEIGWSRQHLSRKFLQHTGITPKFFSQVIRINRLIEVYKDQKANYDFADLAHINGYFDQAHMINEFRRITGVTPKQFLNNL